MRAELRNPIAERVVDGHAGRMTSIQCLAAAVGTAITPELQTRLNLDTITLVSNDRLYLVLESVCASPDEVPAHLKKLAGEDA